MYGLKDYSSYNVINKKYEMWHHNTYFLTADLVQRFLVKKMKLLVSPIWAFFASQNQ